LKRSLSILLLILSLSLALSVNALAQEQPTEPPSSLDVVPSGATPAPLPTRLPQPAPVSRASSERASLEILFETLPQGSTGLVRLTGDNIASARARFLDHLIDFYPMPDGFYGILSAGIETPVRRSVLDVFVTFTDESREPINTEIEVVGGGFQAQEVVVPSDRARLLSPDVERTELARLESIFANVTLERYWDETGYQMPILASLTSPFGAFRTFNGTLNTRHTGWDIRTTNGAPIFASAAGRVAFAGPLDIRGNYVVVDHGYGVYSGYAHMSVMHVTRGQVVTKNQVLGMTGDTGRTSGPHFHWEMAVNGEWVDSVKFIQMWMP
jgi:hypothetical protein